MTRHDKPSRSHLDEMRQAFPRLFQRNGGRPEIIGWSPAGWDDIVRDLLAQIDAALSDELAAAFLIEQVKEKYGTLRFYYCFDRLVRMRISLVAPDGITRIENIPEGAEGYPYKEIDKLVSAAEDRSEVTCAICGNPGTLRNNGWIVVKCDACDSKHGKT